jgi:hypothetical protein
MVIRTLLWCSSAAAAAAAAAAVAAAAYHTLLGCPCAVAAVTRQPAWPERQQVGAEVQLSLRSPQPTHIHTRNIVRSSPHQLLAHGDAHTCRNGNKTLQMCA